MIIEKTNILDVNQQNINEAKIRFVDNLLSSVFPLLNEYYMKKKNELIKIKMEYQDKSGEILEKKKKLEGYMLIQKRFKRINTIIEQIEKMLDGNSLYLKPTFKHEIINILQSITTLDESGLRHYLKYVINIKDKMK
jgi:hypothetical protein